MLIAPGITVDRAAATPFKVSVMSSSLVMLFNASLYCRCIALYCIVFIHLYSASCSDTNQKR